MLLVWQNIVCLFLFFLRLKWMIPFYPCTSTTLITRESFVIWYRAMHILWDSCPFTWNTERHTNTSAPRLWIQLWQGLSLSRTQTSPRHHYQLSECSVAGTPHRLSEWSQQTCRSLLLRSAPAPLLEGGLRVACRVKWKHSSLQLPRVWPRHFLLGLPWDGATHWDSFWSCCSVWSESPLSCFQRHECPAGVGGWCCVLVSDITCHSQHTFESNQLEYRVNFTFTLII